MGGVSLMVRETWRGERERVYVKSNKWIRKEYKKERERSYEK